MEKKWEKEGESESGGESLTTEYIDDNGGFGGSGGSRKGSEIGGEKEENGKSEDVVTESVETDHSADEKSTNSEITGS